MTSEEELTDVETGHNESDDEKLVSVCRAQQVGINEVKETEVMKDDARNSTHHTFLLHDADSLAESARQAATFPGTKGLLGMRRSL